MTKAGRTARKVRRAYADPEAYHERYMKRYEWARRRVNSDKHMAHLWMDEFRYRLDKSDRKRAPFHKGGKP